MEIAHGPLAGSYPEHASAAQIRALKKLALRQHRLLKKARAGKKLPRLGRPKKRRAGKRKSTSRSNKARMAHVRSFKGKGHRKSKKSGHRAHTTKAPGALTARYHSLKRAYHAAGLDLFKKKHGGLTPREWSKKHRKAKHKRSR